MEAARIMSIFFSFLRPQSRPAAKPQEPEQDWLDIRLEDFKPGDPPRRFRTEFATVYQDYSGATVTTKTGAVYRMERGGALHMEMPAVQRLEIADIKQVLSHQVNRVFETTSHVIHFVGGGVFSCVYDQHGKMIEMDSQGLRQSSSPDGVVTVYGSHKPV
jgi:hypothetical protein